MEAKSATKWNTMAKAKHHLREALTVEWRASRTLQRADLFDRACLGAEDRSFKLVSEAVSLFPDCEQ